MSIGVQDGRLIVSKIVDGGLLRDPHHRVRFGSAGGGRIGRRRPARPPPPDQTRGASIQQVVEHVFNRFLNVVDRPPPPPAPAMALRFARTLRRRGAAPFCRRAALRARLRRRRLFGRCCPNRLRRAFRVGCGRALQRFQMMQRRPASAACQLAARLSRQAQGGPSSAVAAGRDLRVGRGHAGSLGARGRGATQTSQRYRARRAVSHPLRRGVR